MHPDDKLTFGYWLGAGAIALIVVLAWSWINESREHDLKVCALMESDGGHRTDDCRRLLAEDTVDSMEAAKR